MNSPILTNTVVIAALAASVSLGLPAQSTADTVMIRGATVHTMGRDGTLENTDILVSGNEIRRIGQDLPVPADIRVFDAEGRPVTPGLWAGVSAIGTVEVPAEVWSPDNGTPALDMRPEFDVTMAYNPNSSLVPIARVEGHTFTLLGAGGGNIINGQGRTAALDGGYGSFFGDRVLFVSLDGLPSAVSGGSRAGQWMLLDQAFAEAREVPENDDTLLTRAGRQVVNRAADDGTVVFDVDRASNILAVIAFADRQGVEPVISGGAEAWMVANALAEAEVPVLLDPLANLPGSFDSLGSRLDNAAILHDAGVTVAFSGAGSHNARKLRQTAGNAVANGLPAEAAIAALTANPAQIFGVDEQFGSIEEGKRADLVLWTGDPLEVTTVAERVIVNGRLDSMESRQTKLRDRYLAEDPAMPRAYIKP